MAQSEGTEACCGGEVHTVAAYVGPGMHDEATHVVEEATPCTDSWNLHGAGMPHAYRHNKPQVQHMLIPGMRTVLLMAQFVHNITCVM